MSKTTVTEETIATGYHMVTSVNKNGVPISSIVINVANTNQMYYGRYDENSKQVMQIKERAMMAAQMGNKNYLVENTVNENEACAILIPTKVDTNMPYAASLPADQGGNPYPVFGNYLKIEAQTEEFGGQSEFVFRPTTGLSAKNPLEPGNINAYFVKGPDMEHVSEAIGSVMMTSQSLSDDLAE